MKLSKLVPFLLIPLLMLSCKKEAPVNLDIKVQFLTGDVKIITDGREKIPSLGDVIRLKDVIVTGKASVLDMLYGNYGIIRVYADSRLSLESLMKEESGDTRINMDQGKIFVTLSRILKARKFQIKTPTQVIAVRGTTFRVTASKNYARLDVLKGTVAVNPVKGGIAVEEIEQKVSMNQYVVLDTKTAEKAAEKKTPIVVAVLKAEEIKAIKEEIKDIKPEIIEKLNEESKSELRNDVLETNQSAVEQKDDSKEKEAKQRELALKKKAEKERTEKERLEKERRDKEEKERLAREEAERIKKEKERLEKAKKKEEEKRPGNVPSL